MKINHIHQGDSLEILKTFPDESINCCVTSPPYWGLRDYGTAKWIGGDATCNHRLDRATRTITENTPDNYKENIQNNVAGEFVPVGENCPKCGALREDQQIGLEATPEAFVERMVLLFLEVRRVLTKDGTLWLNLGDSYYNYEPGAGQKLGKQSLAKTDVYLPKECGRRGNKIDGLKEKDLVGIPWRVAFALQADGWYLRQDIIWHKPNPMPESITDRCTKSHEYIFLMTKSKNYYFDNESIKDPSIHTGRVIKASGDESKNAIGYANDTKLGFTKNDTLVAEKRNKRSVWTVTTKPYAGAHFATFPKRLIEPCILAGCPPGGVVLDPFMGSGTTAYVARDHNRKFVGIELNPEYIELAMKRLEQNVFEF